MSCYNINQIFIYHLIYQYIVTISSNNMVFLLRHKQFINVCLCVRGVYLSYMDSILASLCDVPEDVCVSVYVFVRSLYNRRGLVEWYRKLYPMRDIVFTEIDETCIRDKKDVMSYILLDKYIFVEVNKQINSFLRLFAIDNLRKLYYISNLTTSIFSIVDKYHTTECDRIAIYIDDTRVRLTTNNTGLMSIVGMKVDVERCINVDEWYLRITEGYLGAPNQNREVFTYPMCGKHTQFVQIISGLYIYNNYLFNKRTFEIVIARYNESMEWARKYQDLVTVYEKYNSVSMLNMVPCSRREYLPNVGRESHTYLYHIINNYNNIADNTLFTQCGIEEHKAYCIEEYMFDTGSSRFLLRNFRSIGAKDGRYGFLQHKGKWLQEYNDGKMLSEKRSFKEWWKESLQKPLPPISKYKWSDGAIFSVSAGNILKNSSEYYRNLIKCLSNHSNPETGHYFERAWYYIFEG